MTADDLRLMLRIRHFELALLRLFDAGEVSGTTHTCLGQEHIPVAISALLTDRDAVFSNHRGHGHYLARCGDAEGLLAEILGREGAVCGGVGGSQHLMRDRFWSSGVQGQSLPIAVGAAVHLRRAEPGALACVYIGDGTWGEGSVYEALNMAALWRLPLVVIVENNRIAQTTPVAAHLAGTIGDRARAFGIRFLRVTAPGPEELREAVRPLVVAVREGTGPLIVECVTSRVGPHSKGDDVRSEADARQAREDDWYQAFRAQASPEQRELDEREERMMVDLVTRVLARPPACGGSA